MSRTLLRNQSINLTTGVVTEAPQVIRPNDKGLDANDLQSLADHFTRMINGWSQRPW